MRHKNELGCILVLVFMSLVMATLVYAQNTKIYHSQGGQKITIDNGGELAIKAGATVAPLENITFGDVTKGIVNPPQVATAAATPTTGSNDGTGSVILMPTAAANAAVIAAATPIAGKPQIICNQGANAQRFKVGGATTLNGATAGSYISLATKACALCINVDGTDTMCGTLVVPTPAGP